MSERQHGTPSSAAGPFEPYSVRIALGPAGHDFDPAVFVRSLLEEIASSATASGATVIGHLKCLLRAGDRTVTCNLTSLRTGADCRDQARGPLPAGQEAELDLVVLTYGLPAAMCAPLVAASLDRLLTSRGTPWRVLLAD